MCESEACLSGTRSFCEGSTSFVRLNFGGGDISEINCNKMLKLQLGISIRGNLQKISSWPRARALRPFRSCHSK